MSHTTMSGAHEHFVHRSNWLRAAVLGVNDGLVSVAAVAIGVAGARADVLSAATAALVGGALSMAAGEFVSVSSQRDIEQADVEKERQEQLRGPDARAREQAQLTGIYVDRGLTPDVAAEVSRQLTALDPVRAHARDELGIDIDHYTNPWTAALASSAAFAAGGAIPFLVVLIPGLSRAATAGTVAAAVSVALAASGWLSSWAGGVAPYRGTLRVLLGGAAAMAVTYGVGVATA